MSEYLEIGKIINTHGVRGELKLDPWCEPGEVFEGLSQVYIDGRPVSVRGWRLHQRFVLLTLEGVGDMDAAAALKNRVVSARRDEIELPEGQYFYSDLFGFEVYDSRIGQVIGVLEDVRELPGSDLYVVRDAQGREILVPAVEAFEEEVDFDTRRLVLRTIEGKLPDEN